MPLEEDGKAPQYQNPGVSQLTDLGSRSEGDTVHDLDLQQ